MLSNWFPIRGYDSDDDSRFSSLPLSPFLHGVSLSIRPRLALLEFAAIGSCFFFLPRCDLSFGSFFSRPLLANPAVMIWCLTPGRLHAIDSLRPDYPGPCNGLSRTVRYSHERVHRPVDFEAHSAEKVARFLTKRS